MASLDFSTLGGQVNYWLAHITKGFMGGWNGSGENGFDVGMPQGTPVYSLTSGTVVGHGYYGGGGVVSIQQQPGTVWYYQHLDLNEPSIESGQTTQVQAGQLLGWSGGQLSGGNHPSQKAYSGGPHIEVGINAPWGGIWGPKTGKGPNIDPVPVIRGLFAGIANTGTGVSGTTNPTDTTTTGFAPWDPRGWIAAVKDQFGTLFTWATQPLRILKLVGGAVLIFMASGLVLASLVVKTAPAALTTVGAATGQPEMVAAGTAIRGKTQQRVRFVGQRVAKSRQRGERAKAAAAQDGKPLKTRPPQEGTRPPRKPRGKPVYFGGQRVGTQDETGRIQFERQGAG